MESSLRIAGHHNPLLLLPTIHQMFMLSISESEQLGFSDIFGFIS